MMGVGPLSLPASGQSRVCVCPSLHDANRINRSSVSVAPLPQVYGDKGSARTGKDEKKVQTKKLIYAIALKFELPTDLNALPHTPSDV